MNVGSHVHSVLLYVFLAHSNTLSNLLFVVVHNCILSAGCTRHVLDIRLLLTLDFFAVWCVLFLSLRAVVEPV